MNGHQHAAVAGLPERMPNPELVAALEWLLEGARSGQITSAIAAYSYGPGHVEIKINAQQPMEMYLGCEILRQTLFNFIIKPQAPSRIVKPFGG